MGSYTNNLGLYKVNTETDGNDTFNIETMLNDNWDKIDEKLEKLPIQNGGLYINSETTEENKAEAVKAIKEIGLSASDVGALPLTGGLMSGTIDFAANGADFNTDSWFAIGMDSESIRLVSRKNGKNRLLNLNNITSSLTDALKLWYYDDGNEHTARIFGEHNKPSGTYTGNGSATSRTIHIASIGAGILIISDNGMAIVTSAGAIMGYGTTISGLGSGTVTFKDGVLTLKTADNKLNANGVYYDYQVF